jgi:hypothetical protein
MGFLGWYFTVGCSLRGSRGEQIEKRASDLLKTIKKKIVQYT